MREKLHCSFMEGLFLDSGIIQVISLGKYKQTNKITRAQPTLLEAVKCPKIHFHTKPQNGMLFCLKKKKES